MSYQPTPCGVSAARQQRVQQKVAQEATVDFGAERGIAERSSAGLGVLVVGNRRVLNDQT